MRAEMGGADQQAPAQIDDDLAAALAFHSPTHVMQNAVYGVSVDPRLEQSHDPADATSAAQLDALRSLDDLKDQPERHALLLESILRLLWQRRRELAAQGTSALSSDFFTKLQAYPGDGYSLPMVGGAIA